jgi:Cu+-exporting ATPase
MAIMVGTGRGATAGVLIKNAEALEQLERVDTIVADKTGTLTEGKPSVVAVVPAGSFDDASVVRFAAAVEQHSEHPLATAIARAARERHLDIPVPTHFESVTGKGVRGHADGKTLMFGTPALLSEGGVDTSALAGRADTLRNEGQTVMFLAVDHQLAGLIGVADRIKDSTAEAIRLIHEQGVRIIMLTGDSRTTAAAVARALGIDDVRAEVLPTEKRDIIQQLQREGHRVAMAGDGIKRCPGIGGGVCRHRHGYRH